MKKMVIMLCAFLMFVLVACQSSDGIKANEEKVMEGPPILDLTWGMTSSEVFSVLEEQGLHVEEIVYEEYDGKGHPQILLSSEQCDRLNMNPVPNFPVGEDGISAILFFDVDTTGEAYLTSSYVDVVAESKEFVALELSKLYGDTTDNFWILDNMQIGIADAALSTEVTVEYRATKYVKANFGNF